jgi:hypothetical protein
MTEGQSASEAMKAGNAVEPVKKGPPNIEWIAVKSRRAMPIFQNVRLYDFDGGPAKVQNHNM